jgi:hypothetical protein
LDVAIASMPEKAIFSGAVNLGISDHSLIYTIRKINTGPNTKSQGFVEFRNLKNFNDAAFLDDLHSIPWEDIRFKRNVDEMWQLSYGKHFLYRCWINMPHKGKKIKKKGQCSLGK